MTKWCCTVLCYRPKQDLWPSHTLHPWQQRKHWIQLSGFPHYPKIMILSPEYTLFLSQLAKSKPCAISVHGVLHDCCKFQYHIPLAIEMCYKEQKIKIHYFYFILRLFPEHLGAEIRVTTQLQQQQVDVCELSSLMMPVIILIHLTARGFISWMRWRYDCILIYCCFSKEKWLQRVTAVLGKLCLR